MAETITKLELSKMRLRGKPRCQYCKRPLTFVYEGAKGFTGEKCSKCGSEYLVNTETLEVTRVLAEVS